MAEQNQKNEVKISDNIAGAEFANLMQVFHSKEEFRLMFAHVFEPTGKVVSKVTTTPGHFKRIVRALEENLEKYEAQFGKIEEGQAPVQNGNIGFQSRE
ncbi:MAG: DUF3467 domain-containing protein [Candidatus Moranbacteria bacterium]|nr:DUF3467 domain-containing protein [Candidatus Moranbacteria bacterium]